MQRTTRYSKLIVIILLGILLDACNQRSSSSQETQADSNDKPKFDQEMVAFTYSPAMPTNPERYATIVIGSAGLDDFLVDVDSEDNWRLIEANYGKTGIITGEAESQALKDSVGRRIQNFKDQSLPASNIIIIISSSAIKSAVTKDVIVSISKEFEVPTKIVSETEEGQYAYRAVIPSEFENESFMVDIGSGNTKISWLENEEIRSVDSYGSRFYLDSVREDQVIEEIKALSQQIPEEKRNYCFMIGGAPYEIASITDKYSERYTVFDPLSRYKPDSKRARGGLTILKGIEEGTGSKNFIFDWESNFAIGYILSQN